MATVQQKLSEFPGFGVQYGEKDNPFFTSMVLEDLRRIASKPIGKLLLTSIADARPRVRTFSATSKSEWKSVWFADGVNVVIVPVSITYTQSGFALPYPGATALIPSASNKRNLPGHSFYWSDATTQAGAIHGKAACDGNGCVSIVRFTNAQVMGKNGERNHSFVVLAHELIHVLHNAMGTRHAKDEEFRTIGLGIYREEPITENQVRDAFGMSPRTS
jgi:hypothetical protein